VNLNPVVFAVAAMAAIAVLLIAIGLAGAGGSSVADRLERYASGRRKEPAKAASSNPLDIIQNSAALATVNRSLEARDFGAGMARDIARADLKLKVSEFIAIWAGCVVAIPLVMYALSPFVEVFGNPLALLIGALIGFFLPRFWLNRRKNQRLKAFNGQLADTITLIANALRAGSSFLQSIEMVVRETRPPISTEFGRVIREVNLGLAFDDALNNMGRRVRSKSGSWSSSSSRLRAWPAPSWVSRAWTASTGCELAMPTKTNRIPAAATTAMRMARGVIRQTSISTMRRMMRKPMNIMKRPMPRTITPAGSPRSSGGF
jgi:Flp pilus assembly protein TadB